MYSNHQHEQDDLKHKVCETITSTKINVKLFLNLFKNKSETFWACTVMGSSSKRYNYFKNWMSVFTMRGFLAANLDSIFLGDDAWGFRITSWRSETLLIWFLVKPLITAFKSTLYAIRWYMTGVPSCLSVSPIPCERKLTTFLKYKYLLNITLALMNAESSLRIPSGGKFLG